MIETSNSASHGKAHHNYDIIIIGGGMVGLSLALSLRQTFTDNKFRIAILEESKILQQTQPIETNPNLDTRSTVLSYGSRLIYENIGVWIYIKDIVEPVKNIHVSNRSHFGITRINSVKHQLPALGYVISNKSLCQSMFQLLDQRQIHFFSMAKVDCINEHEQTNKLTVFREGKTEFFNAKLVVLADGGHSTLALQAGLDQIQKDYNQAAIVTNVVTDKPHAHTAYERFTNDGPLALLPLANNIWSLVWTMSHTQAKERVELIESDFLCELQQQFGYRAGRFLEAGRLKHHLIIQKLSSSRAKKGLIMVGNAAHTLHPVAGQGFNLALRDITYLSQTLKQSAQQNQSIANYATLLKFVENRKRDQNITAEWTDFLVNIFKPHSGFTGRATAVARNIGLITLDLCLPVKTLLTDHALGVKTTNVNNYDL